MRKPSLIAVDKLGRKVRLFKAVFDIGSDKDLSEKLNAAPNTLAGWLEGSRLPKHALERLAQMLVDMHPCEVSANEARALWHGPFEAFEDALFRRTPVDLLSVLRTVDRSLSMRMVPVNRGFSMVGDSTELDDTVTEISFYSEYFFELDAEPGMRLTVLCADTRCWRQLAPSSRHPGLVQSRPEIFPLPGRKPIWFEDRGLHQFVFLEHPTELKPMLPRAGALPPLDSWQLDQFAKQLASPLWTGKCRWAGAVYKVV